MKTTLITGATGQLGASIISTLLEKGTTPQSIRALVREAAKAKDISDEGVSLAVGDYDDYPSLTEAMKGIHTLIFVSGSDPEKRAGQHMNVMRATKETGVQRVVYYSLLRKEDREDGGLMGTKTVAHMMTEKALIDSGITYVILQVSLYSDMIPLYAGNEVTTTKTIYLPAEDGKVSWVLRAELGEAGAIIAMDETGKYDNRFIRLTNEEATSWKEIAGMISNITGEHITYVSPSEGEYLETMKHNGSPAWLGPANREMQHAIAGDEFAAVTSDLQEVLQRKPQSVHDYLVSVYGRS